MPATIKCPNCDQEFELTAKVKETEEEPEETPEEPEEEPEETPKEEPGEIPEETPEETPEEESLVSEQLVLFICDDCGARSTIDTLAETPPFKCPKCNSSNFREAGASTPPTIGNRPVSSTPVPNLSQAVESIAEGADISEVADSLLSGIAVEQTELPPKWSGDLPTAISKIRSLAADLGITGAAVDSLLDRATNRGHVKTSAAGVSINVSGLSELLNKEYPLGGPTGEPLQDGSDDKLAKIASVLAKYF
jgi:DNA-directed RNA polymerase subunit RPC12/RpoP